MIDAPGGRQGHRRTQGGGGVIGGNLSGRLKTFPEVLLGLVNEDVSIVKYHPIRSGVNCKGRIQGGVKEENDDKEYDDGGGGLVSKGWAYLSASL